MLMQSTAKYAACLMLLCLGSELAIAQEVVPLLKSGEFAAARRLAENATLPQRDHILAQVATAQSTAGESVAAAHTLRGIQGLDQRDQAIQNGAAGGGAFADFDSLIQLIQQTVVPDTWEALGGPSTMAPYPQGVYVDPNGTVKECETIANSDGLDNLAALLNQKTQTRKPRLESWRQPSELRVVSLRRLRDSLAEHRIAGHPINEAAMHFGGLSQIQYIVITSDDVLLAGSVGGIDSINGWYRDRVSGLTPLRSDFFATCLAAAKNRQPFGCTIDPTPQGMRRAAQVSQAVSQDQIPVGKAAAEMERALGLQRVEVFGTAGDTAIGYVMVEADRHMKQLALGQVEMPDGVNNYLDVIDATIANGPPNQLLLRLWFTSSPRTVRADADRTVFELAGRPIRLSGQNQRALATGQRGKVVVDPRTEMFVKGFNDHWNEIRDKYPIYSALESVYRVASAAELITRHSKSDSVRMLLDSIAIESSLSPWQMPTPRQVQSIAVHHRVRHGRQIHHVVLASGGVSVDTKQTVDRNMADYPSLRSFASHSETKPKLIQAWWWDAH